MTIFTSEHLGRLQATADASIWKSHYSTAGWSYRRNPSLSVPEEDYVASLILVALPSIAKAWKPLFQQWNIKIQLTGVFCHQTPKASYQFGSKKVSPELADLLIVRKHTDLEHKSRQIAVLIQAKMSDNGEIKLVSNDPQLYLYNSWPSFTLLGHSAPKEDFFLGQFPGQAMYAGIKKGRAPDPHNNDAWAGFCPWAMMPPKQRGWVEDSLSFYLTRMLKFEVGRDFYDTSTTGCHWSRLIEYLLEVTFSLPLRTRDIRRTPDFKRGKTISFNRTGFTLSSPGMSSAYLPASRSSELSGDGDPGHPEIDEGDYLEGGMGRVIIIETSDSLE